jgi:lipid A disaccharide synthetase
MSQSGHPLLDRPPPPSRADGRRAQGIGERDRVLGVFPGSRGQEIARHWTPFREAACRMLAD